MAISCEWSNASWDHHVLLRTPRDDVIARNEVTKQSQKVFIITSWDCHAFLAESSQWRFVKEPSINLNHYYKALSQNKSLSQIFESILSIKKLKCFWSFLIIIYSNFIELFLQIQIKTITKVLTFFFILFIKLFKV